GEEVVSELPVRERGSRRREDLFRLRGMLDEQIAPLDQAVAESAENHEQARLLMTQPGVGPVTAMAYVLTMGDVQRFRRGKQGASYRGLIPREHSSAGRPRVGSSSKHGKRILGQRVVGAGPSA